MNILRTLLFFALVAIVLATTAPAMADGACGYGGGYGYGLGYLYGNLEYHVPYFAAHPPVYYSHPVPRTYGYSPFAYPPGVMTPEIVEESQPLELINPHVQSSTSEAMPQDRSTRSQRMPQPLVVMNPYVDSELPVAQVER
jgi:hypothetical protein